MPLLSEDPEKSQWLHQELQENGIVTASQAIVEGFTPKRLMAFGYEIDVFFPRLADGKAQVTKVCEDGGVTTHHQRMITPWVFSNRSVFPTTYHKHSNDVNGPYTLIRSSQGNEAIVEANYHLVGDDVEADFILFWVHCRPITETSSMVQLVVQVSFGG